MGDVISVDFGARRKAAWSSSAAVSVTWSLDRLRWLVWVIDPDDRTRDEEVGTYDAHVAAAGAAVAAGRSRGLLVIDHTAIGTAALWDLRPGATAIHVYRRVGGFYVTAEPDDGGWVASAGSAGSLDAAGDRAVELSILYHLPVVDHALADLRAESATALGGCNFDAEPGPDAA